MGIFRRTSADLDNVDVTDRLAAYEATSTEGLAGRYSSGYTRPVSARPEPVGHIAAPADVPTDRRGAARYALNLPVRAKYPGDETWSDGGTVDASMTGLCIEMDCAAELGYVDVEIEGDTTIASWARVVGCTSVDDGRYRWRLRLVSYEPGYPALLEGLEPLETGFLPPTVEPEPSVDEPVTVGAAGWGGLLDHATA